MRDLVVANREGTTAERVERFTKRAGSDAQAPRFSEHAIKRDRPAHVAMSVLADDPDPRPTWPAASRIKVHASSSSRTSRAMSQPAGPNLCGS